MRAISGESLPSWSVHELGSNRRCHLVLETDPDLTNWGIMRPSKPWISLLWAFPSSSIWSCIMIWDKGPTREPEFRTASRLTSRWHPQWASSGTCGMDLRYYRQFWVAYIQQMHDVDLNNVYNVNLHLPWLTLSVVRNLMSERLRRWMAEPKA